MSTMVAAPPAAAPTAPATLGSRMRAPLVLVMIVVASWALVLNNGVFIDEAVYIRAGRAYLDHWLHGSTLPENIGQGFSGLPQVYPVLAGALDMVGGLALVR